MKELRRYRRGSTSTSTSTSTSATSMTENEAVSSAPPVTDTEPDYRFTLANERTFLAWIRTALALLAGGVAAGQLFVPEADEMLHSLLGSVCVALAAVIALGAFIRWRQVQAAMRRAAPLPGSVMVRITVAGVCLAAVACAAVVAS